MDEKPHVLTKYHLLFDAAVLALAVYAVIGAQDFPRLSRTFPLYAGYLATFFAVAVLIIDTRSYLRGSGVASSPIPDENADGQDDIPLASFLQVGGWMLGYIAGIWVIGMPAATIVFLMSSLVLQAKLSVFWAAVSTAVMTAWLLIFSDLMGLRMPPSLFDLFHFLIRPFT